jgi:hypothetical protein
MELARLADAYSPAVDELVQRLADWSAELGEGSSANERLATAECAAVLISSLRCADNDLERVEALATAEIRPSGLALGRSITTAANIVRELDAAQRVIILTAASRLSGAVLAAEFRTALETDEFVAPLVPVLHDVQGRAVKLLTGVDTPPPPTPPSPGHRGWSGKSVDEAQQKLDELRTKLQAQIVAEESVGITIDWVEAVDNGATDL